MKQPMATRFDVLLVEDNMDLANNLGEFLEPRGVSVDFAFNGVGGLERLRKNRYDALILDLGLPGMDGIKLCRELRDHLRLDLPVLMLTARDSESDKLAGFAAGTDDYLTKPFSPAELFARLVALVRRAKGGLEDRVLHVDELTFDLDTLEATRAGNRLDLSPIGKRLLECLMRANPRVVERDEAERSIWGEFPPDGEGALRLHVHKLRHVVDEGYAFPLIHTVPRRGYRIGRLDED